MIYNVALIENWPTSLNSIQVREILNGIWFCLDIAMLYAFGSRMVKDLAADSRAFRNNEVTQGAVAVSVYLAGATVYRAWTWALLFAQASEGEVSYLGHLLLIPVAAATVGVVGSCCVVRVFTPARHNPMLWISCAVTSVAIPLLVHALFFPV